VCRLYERADVSAGLHCVQGDMAAVGARLDKYWAQKKLMATDAEPAHVTEIMNKIRCLMTSVVCVWCSFICIDEVRGIYVGLTCMVCR